MLELYPDATPKEMYRDLMRIVDKSKARPIVSTFNAILCAIQKRMSGHLHEPRDALDTAVRVLDAMSRRAIVPDDFSFSLVYKMCAMASDEGYLRLFEARAKEEVGSLGGEIACRSLICTRGKLGDVDGAEELAGNMVAHGLKLNERAYICLISACHKAGRHARVWYHFANVINDPEIQPTVYLFSGVVSSCCRAGDTIHARIAVDAMVSRDIMPGAAILDNVFGLAVRVGDVNLATDVLFKWGVRDASFRPTADHIIKFIASAGRNRKEIPVSQAVQLVRRAVADMRDVLRIAPELQVLNAAADALARLGYVKEAANILTDDLTSYGFTPDVTSFNALIRVFGGAREPREAAKVLRLMRQEGIQPDQATYNALLRAAHIGGDTQMAQALLVEIDQNPKLSMDATVTMTVLKRMREARDSGGVMALHARSVRKNVLLNGKAYGAVLATLTENGREQDAISVFGWLLCRGLGSVTVFNVMIHQFGRRLDVHGGGYDVVERLFAAMKRRGLALDEVTYTSMIRACCKHGRLDRAFRLLGEMQDIGVGMADSFAWTTLINGCGQGGQWQRGVDLLRLMRSSGGSSSLIPPPSTPCYNAALYAAGVHGSCWRTSLDIFKALMADPAVCPDAVSYSAMASIILKHRFHITEIGVVAEVLRNLQRIVEKERGRGEGLREGGKGRDGKRLARDGDKISLDGAEIKKLQGKIRRLNWIVQMKNGLRSAANWEHDEGDIEVENSERRTEVGEDEEKENVFVDSARN